MSGVWTVIYLRYCIAIVRLISLTCAQVWIESTQTQWKLFLWWIYKNKDKITLITLSHLGLIFVLCIDLYTNRKHLNFGKKLGIGDLLTPQTAWRYTHILMVFETLRRFAGQQYRKLKSRPSADKPGHKACSQSH